MRDVGSPRWTSTVVDVVNEISYDLHYEGTILGSVKPMAEPRVSTSAIYAGICFVIAKGSGLAGIALAYAGNSFLGGFFFVVAFLMLAVCVAICVVDMHRRNKRDEADVDAIDRMLEDGTLEKRLERAGYRMICRVRRDSNVTV